MAKRFIQIDLPEMTDQELNNLERALRKTLCAEINFGRGVRMSSGYRGTVDEIREARKTQ